MRALAGGDESARPAKPDVAGLRAIDSPSHTWPMDEVLAARRVIVRVNVFSADVDTPGWALSEDEVWFA